jgi:formate hydrogenlyase subunit 4
MFDIEMVHINLGNVRALVYGSCRQQFLYINVCIKFIPYKSTNIGEIIKSRTNLQSNIFILQLYVSPCAT